MSFLNIKDPKRRDVIVAEYLATKNRLKTRSLNERAQDLLRHDDLKEMFSPVVDSTEKSTTTITKELTPLRKEMRNLNKRLVEVTEKKSRTRLRDKDQITSGSTHFNVMHWYLHNFDDTKIDKYFGIQQKDGGQYIMGDKNVTIDADSNLYVDGLKFRNSPGLWSLIMLKRPSDDSYNRKDLRLYKELIDRTNVMYNIQNVVIGRSKPKTTYKWRNIIEPLQEEQFSSEDESSSYSDRDEYTDSEGEKWYDAKNGEGIQFLPADIKGLSSKLNLLLAEYDAGNRSSTRNEIVAILDELLRRKEISQKEYKHINLYLAKCL